MSYILDALRKSEQQRQRGEAPLLFATQISSNAIKRPAFIIYSLVAVFLICAGVLIGWLHPWQPDRTQSSKDTIALEKHEEKLPKVALIPQPLKPELEKASKPELVVSIEKSISTKKPASGSDKIEHNLSTPIKEEMQPRKSKASIATSKVPEKIIDGDALQSSEKSTLSAVEINGSSGSNNRPLEQKIIAMAELPLAIQQEIPMMTISGYAYSNVPKERSVGINDRLLQEGEYLVPGLRLEQISADGLVFSYKKYFFRHSL